MSTGRGAGGIDIVPAEVVDRYLEQNPDVGIVVLEEPEAGELPDEGSSGKLN